MSRRSYRVEKLPRDHADSSAVSRYHVIELQDDGIATGRQATYVSEHKPVLSVEDKERLRGKLVGRRELPVGVEPSKTQMRKPRYAPRYGSTAFIKKLTRTEGGGGVFPKNLALKCFVSEAGEAISDTWVRAAQGATAFYVDEGDVAACFSRGEGEAEKHFMLMPWGGDKDFEVVLNDIRDKKLPSIPAVHLLKAFEKLLRRVENFHSRTGMCIGDIKPRNLMPIYNDASELVDFMFIDMDGAFSDDNFFTPEYLAEQDFEDMLLAGKTHVESSFQTDFHNLAATWAQAVPMATVEGYIGMGVTWIKPVVVREDGATAVLPRKVPVIVCDLLGATAEARAADNIESRAVRWVWKKLADGINPVVIEPAAGMTHTPLQHFLCNDRLKYQIISDCQQLLSYFDREIVSPTSEVVAPDSPLTAAARKARLTRAFNRGMSPATQSERALQLVGVFSAIHLQMHKHLTESTDLTATHFQQARVKLMSLVEPWQRDDPELIQFIAENGLFADPFAVSAAAPTAAAGAATAAVSDVSQLDLSAVL